MPAHDVRPCLEELEPRVVLDAMSFTGLAPGASTDWFQLANWFDVTLGRDARALPGAHDDVTIPAGLTAVVNGAATTIQSLDVLGTLTVGTPLAVEANGHSGSGDATVESGGSMTVGNPSNAQATASLDVSTLTDDGTVTVGGLNGGSSGTLDAVFASLISGVLNIGDPGAGLGGDVTVSNTMTVDGRSGLNVGGANGSGGLLDVGTLTSDPTDSGFSIVVNSVGKIEVKSSAALSGDAAVAGGEIEADQGASVVLGGGGTVGGTGKLSAQINASFTFGPISAWTILPGNPPGSALNDGQFNVDGFLTVDTALSPDGDITLNNDGSTTLGNIIGTGSLSLSRAFNWNGGTVSLTGGVTVTAQADLKLDGSDPKTLSTNLTNISSNTDFGGTGVLTITSGNTLDNTIGTIDVSLPLITGAGTFSNSGGNSAFVNISSPGPTGLTISSVLIDNGKFDFETGAGPLTLSDTSGASILNGTMGMNDGQLLITGIYTTTTSFGEDWSPTDLTTLTGTLTIASGASADFDHMVVGSSSSGSLITGPGDFSIDATGLNTGDFLTVVGATMSGTGTITIGANATLNLTGALTLDSRTLENHGTVSWTTGSITLADSSRTGGPAIHNERGGLFDDESISGGGSPTFPTFTNDGTLQLGAASAVLMVGSFTQSSTGKLVSDISSDSSGYPIWGAVAVANTATLDGTLQVVLQNYQPPPGLAFEVMTFASSSGQFAMTTLPTGMTVDYTPTFVAVVQGGAMLRRAVHRR